MCYRQKAVQIRTFETIPGLIVLQIEHTIREGFKQIVAHIVANHVVQPTTHLKREKRSRSVWSERIDRELPKERRPEYDRYRD